MSTITFFNRFSFVLFQGYLLIHRTEPALKHQERVQTLCDVTMHYFGSNLKLEYERTDPRDEVMIEQQHCGGNTLVVFRENILAHSKHSFKLTVGGLSKLHVYNCQQ